MASRPMPRYTAEEREEKVRIVAESIKNLKGCVAGCKTAGIPYNTFRDWLKRDAKLSDIIKEARDVFEDKGEEYAVLSIFRAMEKQWQAAAWWLERKLHDKYGLKSKQEITSKCDMTVKDDKLDFSEILKALDPAGRKTMTALMNKAIKAIEEENQL